MKLFTVNLLFLLIAPSALSIPTAEPTNLELSTIPNPNFHEARNANPTSAHKQPEAEILEEEEEEALEESQPSTPNTAHQARDTLKKKDWYDCNGSSACHYTSYSNCLKAAFRFQDKKIYYDHTRFWQRNLPGNPGYCLAMWKCEDKRDYDYGMSGVRIRKA
ncbi:hypothetical protein TWF281_000328 [Arthrobotrys megalospora]